MSENVWDIVSKIAVGVGVTIGVGLIWWAKRKFFEPAARAFRSLSTLIDDITKIKTAINPEDGGLSLKESVAAIRESLTIVEARQRGLVATLARATFETDESFNWVDCNMAMERLTGVGFSHLERKRWISRIHEDDRGYVMQEIAAAVADKRGATATFRFLKTPSESHSDSVQVVKVRLEATPIFNRNVPDQVICWSGSLSHEEERRLA